jgi:hypothetical protein
MEPIASRLLLAFVVIGGEVGPSLADGTVSADHLRDPALPAFVSPSGRSTFKTAVTDNSASAIAARRAAEALGAKFSDITTGSISPGAPPSPPEAAPESTPLPQAEADPPHVVEPKDEGRSIVLSSRQNSDVKASKDLGKSQTRTKLGEMGRGTSRNGARKQSAAPSATSTSGGTGLAAIGQKVSFVELLTNPALWHWPTMATTPNENASYANR